MPCSLTRSFLVIVGAVALVATTGITSAEPAKGQLEAGKKLVAEAKCEACHISKVGGDGSAMYSRKDRRVTARSKLLPQVERCNSQLNLGLFPDDETAIAAYLNAAHYKFKD